jgi:hypothetical protein
MPKMQFDSSVLGDFEPAQSTIEDENCRKAVLNTYTTALRTPSLREQDAFDAAVKTYLARNPDVTMKAARRVVAGIICGKP